MKLTITIKEVNSEFDYEYAEKSHNGRESSDNIKYNWEDQLELINDITDLKIRNRAVYILRGERDGQPFEYEIPDMTILDCTGADGSLTQFAFSRRILKDTKKSVTKEGDVQFFVFLKDSAEQVNPVEGIYIHADDFPIDLPKPEEVEISGEEDEEDGDEEE